MSAVPARGWFVTGTDTEVGKTLAACALLHALRARGLRAVGMKPVAAGSVDGPDGARNEDVEALLAASDPAPSRALLNPCLYAEPIAPHIAAQRAGRPIERARMRSAFEALAASADAVVVEGVGGFRVPLGDDWDAADLAVDLALPVVLVVGLRLGCINHALLTAEAIGARGLALAGWIGNRIDPAMLCADENLAALRARLRAPLLGVLPHMRPPDAAAAARHLALPPHAGAR